jgi:hypothetical protein
MKSKKIDKGMEARIEKLIDVYCDHMFSPDRDAGWHGWHAPSQLESLVTACNKKRASFQRKQLTVRFAANDERQVNDRSDDKMISKTRFLRKKHHDFGLAKMLFARLEDKQLVALLGERYLTYVFHREFNEQEVAEYAEVSKASFRHNKMMANWRVRENFVFIDQYERVKCA